MTTPNNTVAGLVEKWRADAARYADDNEAAAVNSCAKDLEAALASPAPSALVVDDATLRQALHAMKRCRREGGNAAWDVYIRRMETALSGVSAPVEDGQRDRLTNMLNMFADQQGWITLADGRTYGALQCLLHVFNGKDLQQPAWNAPPAAAPRVEDDPNGQHCQECRFTMSGLGYCVNCATPTPTEDNATPAAEQPEAPPSVAGDAGELPEVEELTPKQAWWAGARAALGLPADTPRIEVARRLATAEQPTKSIRVGFSTQGEPMYANVPAEQPCPKCAKTFTGYCDSCAAKLDEQPGWTPDVAKQPSSAVQGDRVKVLEMFLGRIFAAQQLNDSREYKGWKISGRGSLNEVVAEAREYLNCPLGAVDMLPPAPAAEQGDPRAQYDASGRLIAYDARGGGMYTQPEARGVEGMVLAGQIVEGSEGLVMLAAAPSGVRVDDATESHPVIVANRIAQARAFEAVCDLLNKVLPGWCDTDALGGFEQMACDAIHILSERRGRWHFAGIDLAPDLLRLLGIKNAIGANPEGQAHFDSAASELARKMLDEFQKQWTDCAPLNAPNNREK